MFEDLMIKVSDAYWAQEDGTEKALERVVSLVIEECANTADTFRYSSERDQFDEGIEFAASAIAHAIRKNDARKEDVKWR